MDISRRKKLLEAAGFDVAGSSDDRIMQIPNEKIEKIYGSLQERKSILRAANVDFSKSPDSRILEIPEERINELRSEALGLDAENVSEDAANIPLGRFLVKNFGDENSPKAFDFLQQKYPDHTFIRDGDILRVRAPGETTFKRFDPERFDVQDISDVAYDVGSGLLQTFGTVASAIPTGGAAAIPAMGLLAAGDSALKQKIGTETGVADFNPNELAISTALGAAMPAGGVVSRAIGLPKLGAKAASKLAAWTHGANDTALMKFFDRTYKDTLKPLMGESLDSLNQYVSKTVDPILDAASRKKQEVGSALGAILGSVDAPISTTGPSGPKTVIRKEIAKLQDAYLNDPSEANRKKLTETANFFRQFFTVEDEIPVSSMWKLKQNFSDLSSVGKNLSNVSDPLDKNIKRIAGRAAKAADEATTEGALRYTGQNTKPLQEKYGKQLDLERTLQEGFDYPNPNRPELGRQVTTLRNLGTKTDTKRIMGGAINDLNLPDAEKMAIKEASDNIYNADVLMGGSTPTQVPNLNIGGVGRFFTPSEKTSSKIIELMGRVGSNATRSEKSRILQMLGESERGRAGIIQSTVPTMGASYLKDKEDALPEWMRFVK